MNEQFDSHNLEEGEIGSQSSDVSSCGLAKPENEEDMYTPLERPHREIHSSNIVDQSDDSDVDVVNQSESSDDDSEDCGQPNKRMCLSNSSNQRTKPQGGGPKIGPRDQSVTRDLYHKKPSNRFGSVWSSMLQSESLSMNLGQGMEGLTPLQDDIVLSDRGVESYSFVQKPKLKPSNHSRLSSRLGRKSAKDSRECLKKNTRIPPTADDGENDQIADIDPELLKEVLNAFNETEADPKLYSKLGSAIAVLLKETKSEYLCDLVKAMGFSVSIMLFKDTQKMELDGGMMTKDGERRRSAGGVFLQLVRDYPLDETTRFLVKRIMNRDSQKDDRRRKNRPNDLSDQTPQIHN